MIGSSSYNEKKVDTFKYTDTDNVQYNFEVVHYDDSGMNFFDCIIRKLEPEKIKEFSHNYELKIHNTGVAEAYLPKKRLGFTDEFKAAYWLRFAGINLIQDTNSKNANDAKNGLQRHIKDCQSFEKYIDEYLNHDSAIVPSEAKLLMPFISQLIGDLPITLHLPCAKQPNCSFVGTYINGNLEEYSPDAKSANGLEGIELYFCEGNKKFGFVGKNWVTPPDSTARRLMIDDDTSNDECSSDQDKDRSNSKRLTTNLQNQVVKNCDDKSFLKLGKILKEYRIDSKEGKYIEFHTHETIGDGNCFFRAVTLSLSYEQQQSYLEEYKNIRSDYLKQHFKETEQTDETKIAFVLRKKVSDKLGYDPDNIFRNNNTWIEDFNIVEASSQEIKRDIGTFTFGSDNIGRVVFCTARNFKDEPIVINYQVMERSGQGTDGQGVHFEYIHNYQGINSFLHDKKTLLIELKCINEIDIEDSYICTSEIDGSKKNESSNNISEQDTNHRDDNTDSTKSSTSSEDTEFASTESVLLQDSAMIISGAKKALKSEKKAKTAELVYKIGFEVEIDGTRIDPKVQTKIRINKNDNQSSFLLSPDDYLAKYDKNPDNLKTMYDVILSTIEVDSFQVFDIVFDSSTVVNKKRVYLPEFRTEPFDLADTKTLPTLNAFSTIVGDFIDFSSSKKDASIKEWQSQLDFYSEIFKRDDDLCYSFNAVNGLEPKELYSADIVLEKKPSGNFDPVLAIHANIDIPVRLLFSSQMFEEYACSEKYPPIFKPNSKDWPSCNIPKDFLEFMRLVIKKNEQLVNDFLIMHLSECPDSQRQNIAGVLRTLVYVQGMSVLINSPTMRNFFPEEKYTYAYDKDFFMFGLPKFDLSSAVNFLTEDEKKLLQQLLNNKNKELLELFNLPNDEFLISIGHKEKELSNKKISVSDYIDETLKKPIAKALGEKAENEQSITAFVSKIINNKTVEFRAPKGHGCTKESLKEHLEVLHKKSQDFVIQEYHSPEKIESFELEFAKLFFNISSDIQITTQLILERLKEKLNTNSFINKEILEKHISVLLDYIRNKKSLDYSSSSDSDSDDYTSSSDSDSDDNNSPQSIFGLVTLSDEQISSVGHSSAANEGGQSKRLSWLKNVIKNTNGVNKAECSVDYNPAFKYISKDNYSLWLELFSLIKSPENLKNKLVLVRTIFEILEINDDIVTKALLKVHDKDYMQNLIARSCAIKKGNTECYWINKGETKPDVLMTNTTFEVYILDIMATIEQNCLIGLSIGLPSHHAYAHKPAGFCFINKVAVMAVVNELRFNSSARKIFIGLDVNRDDGLAKIIWGRLENCYHMDVFDSTVYPNHTTSLTANNNVLTHLDAQSVKQPDKAMKRSSNHGYELKNSHGITVGCTVNNCASTISYDALDLDLVPSIEQQSIHPYITFVLEKIRKELNENNKVELYIPLGFDSSINDHTFGKCSINKRFKDNDFIYFCDEIIKIYNSHQAKIRSIYISLEGGYIEDVLQNQLSSLLNSLKVLSPEHQAEQQGSSAQNRAPQKRNLIIRDNEGARNDSVHAKVLRNAVCSMFQSSRQQQAPGQHVGVAYSAVSQLNSPQKEAPATDLKASKEVYAHNARKVPLNAELTKEGKNTCTMCDGKKVKVVANHTHRQRDKVYADNGIKVPLETKLIEEKNGKTYALRDGKEVEVVSYSNFYQRLKVYADNGSRVPFDAGLNYKYGKTYTLRDGKEVEVVANHTYRQRDKVYADTGIKVPLGTKLIQEKNGSTYALRDEKKVEVIAAPTFRERRKVYVHNGSMVPPSAILTKIKDKFYTKLDNGQQVEVVTVNMYRRIRAGAAASSRIRAGAAASSRIRVGVNIGGVTYFA